MSSKTHFSLNAHFLMFMILIAMPMLPEAQNFTAILGRPTQSSVSINILFDQKTEVYWEYGTVTVNYLTNTTIYIAEKDQPLETDINALLPGNTYFYRTRYRLAGSTSPFFAAAEQTFQTQRAPGSTFSFAVTADPHLDTNSNPSSYTLTLQNIYSRKPDFLIDLGDIFMSEKLQVKTQTEITNRHLLYRPYFNEVCQSVPLYLVLGNHEGELGWMLNGMPGSLPVMASNTRKLYYPNPSPGSFYSGNTREEPFVGLRENYYAWQWGDALFIVLDPYWYTLKKPDWGWTLGPEQYNWFKNVISTSKAKYKFVFCHNLLGGKGSDARGGSEYAGFFEMGGNNPDASWGFDEFRSGWEKPIHQLMAENNTTIFFHGHDHFYGKQEKDGIIYQEVPQPSNKNITNISATQYGYVDGVLLAGRGYLLVTVSATGTRVEYISTYLPAEENATRKNRAVAHSYEIPSTFTGKEENQNKISGFNISQNYPNPFAGITNIHYSVPADQNVELKIYDLLGREITTLVNQPQKAGDYVITVLPGQLNKRCGIYYCVLKAGNNSKSIKMSFTQ